MNKKKLKKILFFSFIFLVGFFVFLNTTDAAKKTFGEKCKTDADCKYGGECTTRCNTGIEEFDKKCPQGEKGKKYCTCKKNSKGQINNFSCAKAYDKPENNKNWKCILKVNQKKDKGLPYCLNKKNNNKYFPITGKDKDTDEEKKQRFIDEKDLMSPGPEIDIPGLDFTGSSSLPMVNGPGGKYIVIPYIGEYISAVYDWSMIAASTLAVLVIIVSGMQWMFPGANIVTKGSGGQKQQINQAKSRVLKAISGLLLIASSYVILFTINPELVEFDNLKVRFIERQEIPGDSAADPDAEVNYDENSFDCDNPPSARGVAPKDEVITYTCPGLTGQKVTSLPKVKEPLCKVGQLAKKGGYKIYITSSYRPFKTQVRLWCNSDHPVDKRRSYVALPGTSIHGSGLAVDVKLLKDEKVLTGRIDSDAQCNIKEKYIKKLSNLFYKADSNFVRYETEIWHFEYGTSDKTLRGQYKSYPKECKK